MRLNPENLSDKLCLDLKNMTGEITHFFTRARLAPWALIWLCGKGKNLEAFLSIITKRGD